MNSESLVLRQLAIRERRQYLDLVYSKDGAAPKRAGLVALSRAVYLLAARRIVRPENRPADAPELVKVSWEIEWYGHYLEALQELTPLLQTAIRDRRIIPRGIRTSAPVGLDQISRWLDLDPRAMIAASTKAFFAGIVLPTEPYAIWAGWPDALILSSGVFVTLNDLTAWVKTEGIATSEEMTALLSATECSPSGAPENAAPPVPVVTPAAATITRNKLRTDSLDAPIQKAIEQAGSLKTAAVFTCLKELARSGEALPFTGYFEGSAFGYTTDDDTTALMTKNALDKRLAKLRKLSA